MNGRRAALAATGICAVVTAAVVVIPSVPYALRNVGLHIALETTAVWISLAAAALAYGRYRRRQLARDLALTAAFVLFGTVNLLLSAIPSVVSGVASTAIATWGALAGRTLAALFFAYAAFAPEEAVDRRRAGLVVVGGAIALVAAIGGLSAAFAAALPLAIAPDGPLTIAPDNLQPGDVHPVVPALQALNALTFAVAAVGFVRWTGAATERRSDGLSRWLAAAAVTAGFARVHYFLVPSLYTTVVYSGDLLRVGFYVLLLCGVAGELRVTWRALAAGAAAEERRRIARDLHDGLAQELAFIASQSSSLAKRQPEQPRLALLASAAQRALDESRRAIEALIGGPAQPLPVAVAQAAEEVANRFQKRVVLDLDEGVDVADAVKEQLLRVVREAVANAARHGDPEVVAVALSGGESVILEVSDDGRGFDVASATDGGTRFGLTSMRERAEALGGAFSVESKPGEGTRVVVTVPWTK